MKVDGKRLDREEGTKYLKGLGIDMEIPRSYNQSTLDKIVDKVESDLLPLVQKIPRI